MSSLSGQSIGRYHIIEPLGEGGMATIYKAFDIWENVGAQFERTIHRLPA